MLYFSHAMKYPIFSTYMLTNESRTVLYTGMTNNLRRRLIEHWVGKKGSFTDRYLVRYLLWWEDTRYVLNAIALEKEIKDFAREKKEAIIARSNPAWEFKNAEIVGYWPPTPEDKADVLAFWHKHPEEKEKCFLASGISLEQEE